MSGSRFRKCRLGSTGFTGSGLEFRGRAIPSIYPENLVTDALGLLLISPLGLDAVLDVDAIAAAFRICACNVSLGLQLPK